MTAAVVLWSGGLDSTACMAWAHRKWKRTYPLSFFYGQKHDHALGRPSPESFEQLARYGMVEHLVVNLPELGSRLSSLVSGEIEPVKGMDPARAGVPDTYVPGRNLVLLSWALSIAEEVGCPHVVFGANVLDYSGYPDCRPEFLAAFQRAAREGTTVKDFQIHAPLLHMTKAQIVRMGRSLGVDYALTSSCYSPDMAGRACGLCDSCQIRLEGFRQAGFEDPALYAG